MDTEPTKLAYAPTPPIKRFSWKLTACVAGAGLITLPVAVLLALGLGCIGAVAAALIPIAVGIFVGRYGGEFVHIAGHTAVFSIAGVLPAIAMLLTEFDPSDPLANLTLYLSFAYPLMGAAALFAVTLPAAIVAHKHASTRSKLRRAASRSG